MFLSGAAICWWPRPRNALFCFIFKNYVNAYSFVYSSDIFFHLIHTIFRDLIIHVSLKMGHLVVATTS